MRLKIPIKASASIATVFFCGVVVLALVYPADLTVGQMFEAEGDFDSAITYFRAWNHAHPRDFNSRWHTADLMMMTVRPEQATETLEAMREQWPDDTRIIRRLAEIEDSLLRMDGVLPLLELLAKKDPDDPKVYRDLADAYRWRGRQGALVRTLSRLVKLGHFPEEHEELVDILLANQRFEELIGLLEEKVRAQPDAIESHQALYEAYLRTGRYEKAIASVRRMMALEPEKLEHLRELADQLVTRGRADDALALYEERIALEPRNRALLTDVADLYRVRAAQLVKSGQRSEGIALLRRQVKRDPTNLALRLEFADLHGKKATDAAIAQLRELTRLTPESPRVWMKLGIRLGWKGRLRDAVAALEKAFALAPDDSNIKRALARHAIWAGQETRATELFEGLAQSEGKLADMLALSELLADSEQWKKVMPYARKLVALQPKRLRHHRLLASAALEVDRCEVALKPLQRLLARYPQDMSSWVNLGRCAKRLGRRDDVERALKALRGLSRHQRRREE